MVAWSLCASASDVQYSIAWRFANVSARQHSTPPYPIPCPTCLCAIMCHPWCQWTRTSHLTHRNLCLDRKSARVASDRFSATQRRKWPLFSAASLFFAFCYIEPYLNMDHSGRPYGIWGALSLKEFARVLLIRFSVAFSKWFHPYWTISRSYILCKSNLQNPMRNDTFLYFFGSVVVRNDSTEVKWVCEP